MSFVKRQLGPQKKIARILLQKGLLLFIFIPTALVAQSVFDHPVSAGAFPPALKELSANLQGHHTLRAQFIQTRKISILQHPLVTKGDLLFSAKNGVHLQTNSPLVAEVLISPEGYFERKNGQLILQSPASAGAGLQGYLKAFILIFSGNFQKLNHLFEFSFLETPPSWTVGLTPKDLLAKVLKNIEISGDIPADLKRIVIRETNGDLTQIELYGTKSSTSRLSSAELRLFE